MSNFAFLHPEWAQLFDSASKAEQAVNSDARASCFYARRTLEQAVNWLYKHDSGLRLPYQDNLSALIHEPTFVQTVGEPLFAKARLIKDIGNLAVHSSRKIQSADALSATRELFHFCYWLARTYGRSARPAPNLMFSVQFLPKAEAVAQQTAEQLQVLENQVRERDEKLNELIGYKTAVDLELAALREQIANAKQANTATPDTHDYSEAETRKAFIDLLLAEAGWELNPAKNFEIEVTGMPNNEGKGFVDYVLWGDDGKPLALIEAKRTTRDPNEGKQQAKLYADCLEQMYGQRPVIFYSNGYTHWIWDDLNYPPRLIQGFYKKAELERLIQRRTSRKPLGAASINTEIIERPYQQRAVRRVGESFERDRLRKSLLVMATGSGKTRTVIALADVLMRCNWAKRVLFLADRIALVNQAVNAFKTHLPDASPVNLVADKSAEGRVFVSTYPTMMGLIDDAEDGQRRFGPGHFDLIIIDEAHRSVYQKYGAIFDYFDSLLVGLTATPKSEIDHNTYRLFDLESGVPTDAYSLDEAVADKYLVPPVPLSVPLQFQREGIKYDELTEEEKEEWDALEWGDDGAPPAEVDAAALNNWLFNTDTVDKVLEYLMTHGQKVAGGDRLGKTIIFAKNNDHAQFISDRFDKNYPNYRGHFARVVTYKTEYAQSLIDDFSKKEKAPHIAISVDMLDTGVDVPEVVNLVFFKAVRSKTKFWQMVGRGTRLCKDLFGPGQDKQNFFIFDFCQNLEFFSENSKFSEPAVSKPLSERLFLSRLDLVGLLDDRLPSAAEGARSPYEGGQAMDERQLRNLVADQLYQYVTEMNVGNFIVRPHRQYIERYAQKDQWNLLSATDRQDLAEHVASLPSQFVDNDEDAKRFDMLMLRAQLATLNGESEIDALKDRIQKIGRLLEAQASIPAIQTHLTLIQSISDEIWWENVTAPQLEIVRRKLRALIKLIPKGEKIVVYSDVEDTLGAASVITLPGVSMGLDMEKFREKARQFLQVHEDHISLQKLRRNQPLTSTDLDELEKMLQAAGGSAALINAATEQANGLGIFVRSLVGLEREAVMEAFSNFTNSTALSANQFEFLEMMIQELAQNGTMEADRLFQSPYTDINAQGPVGIFPPAKVTELVQVLDTIRQRAAA